MEEKIVKILNEMSEYLSITQMKKLQEVILKYVQRMKLIKWKYPIQIFLKCFWMQRR